MKLKIAVLLSGLVFVAATLFARSSTAIQAFNQGAQQVNAGHYAEAVPYFDKAIDHDEAFAEAYYARAICKRNLQDPQGALSDLNQAIQNKSEYIDAYALRGAVFYEQEQWDPALQDFDHVLQSRPNDAQALLGRGVISLKQSHLSTATHDFRLFVKLRPDDPLTPKLRRLLASLADEPAEAESTPDRPAAGRPMSHRTEQLAKDLFENSHALSAAYQHKALRGERSEVTGDINAVH